MWTLLLSFACAPEAPTSAADCRFAFGDREGCMLRVAKTLFATDPTAAVSFVETEIDDEALRNFALLQLVQDFPNADRRICEKITSASLRASCTTAVQRPHLHTEGGGGPRGAPPPDGKPR